mmetsp:Transcript_23318/g.65544  ORF Transcript_23318/g.65544 Transcript_23318/m.65544 type:complete len:295 (-) Transcript_23318:62-946(-)
MARQLCMTHRPCSHRAATRVPRDSHPSPAAPQPSTQHGSLSSAEPRRLRGEQPREPRGAHVRGTRDLDLVGEGDGCRDAEVDGRDVLRLAAGQLGRQQHTRAQRRLYLRLPPLALERAGLGAAHRARPQVDQHRHRPLLPEHALRGGGEAQETLLSVLIEAQHEASACKVGADGLEALDQPLHALLHRLVDLDAAAARVADVEEVRLVLRGRDGAQGAREENGVQQASQYLLDLELFHLNLLQHVLLGVHDPRRPRPQGLLGRRARRHSRKRTERRSGSAPNTGFDRARPVPSD